MKKRQAETKQIILQLQGANDRIWNSAQKLCEYDPETFANYFSNLAVDTACKAWLGPNYQMTAQINLVRPSGAAQSPHRDYHLGFQTKEIARVTLLMFMTYLQYLHYKAQ
jgi:ectoine hydroxylase-related dioxygenase (phytanoyl-CoA dioxygenase family)